jgi:glycerol-3-phosphate dehydrogenase
VTLEPEALQEEIDFVLHHFNKYSTAKISRADVKSVFVGLRPLAKIDNESSTAVMPRDHKITILPSGLIHVTGGKWTTYRSMAQHAIDIAIQKAQLEFVKCMTKRLQIHGWSDLKEDSHLSIYGSDAEYIKRIMKNNTDLAVKLHSDFPYTKAEVVWIIQNEMPQTVEDILARRIRLLFLDAKAARECGPIVARLMAYELNKSDEWISDQIQIFNQLTKTYFLT